MSKALERYAQRDARRREEERRKALAVAGEEVGRLNAEIGRLTERNERLTEENAELKRRIEELEGKGVTPTEDKTETEAPAESHTEEKKPVRKAK